MGSSYLVGFFYTTDDLSFFRGEFRSGGRKGISLFYSVSFFILLVNFILLDLYKSTQNEKA